MGHTGWITKKWRHYWQTYDVIIILIKNFIIRPCGGAILRFLVFFSIGSLAPSGGQSSHLSSDCIRSEYWLSNEVWLIHVWLIADAMTHADRELCFKIWRFFCDVILTSFETLSKKASAHFKILGWSTRWYSKKFDPMLTAPDMKAKRTPTFKISNFQKSTKSSPYW